MTLLPPDGPLPELSTTRVGGGASARVIAVAVAGLLVGVVGFTVINRPPAPLPPTPTAPAIAIAPTAAPTAAPPRNQIEGNDGILGWPVVTQLGVYSRSMEPHDYRYVVVTTIVGGRTRVLLAPRGIDTYGGDVTVSTRQVRATLGLEIGRQWTEQDLQVTAVFDRTGIGLQRLLKSRGRLMTMTVIHMPPDSTPGLPSALTTGYEFTVLGQRSGAQLTFTFELALPPATQFADYSGPRGPGYFNRCRWGVGPQGAPPRGNQDEAGCLGT